MNRELAIQIANDFIRKEERIATVLSDGRIQAYWDSKGKVWTIGWGNTYYENGQSVKEGDIITRSRADSLLDKIVREKEAAIRPYILVALNENQYASLISVAYNCGEGNLRSSTLLKLINSNADPAVITDRFDETCVTASGVYVSGLFNRRVRETTLFFSKVTQAVKNNPLTSMAAGAIFLGLVIYYTYRVVKSK